MEAANKIILKSYDGESFELDEAVACESQTIKHMIEDDCASNGIPLPNVTGAILAMVIEYCKKHVEADVNGVDKDFICSTENAELKTWDNNFLKVDQPTLFSSCFFQAANYLDINGLLDLTCKAVADMMKDKTPEQMRTHFNIKNDYTPEEEEEVRNENRWAFE